MTWRLTVSCYTAVSQAGREEDARPGSLTRELCGWSLQTSAVVICWRVPSVLCKFINSWRCHILFCNCNVMFETDVQLV